MTPQQQNVLFWLFIGFFMLIGLLALLAITGMVKTEDRFRRWAVGGFVVGVTGVVMIWAKSQSPVDLFVNLMLPDEVDYENVVLESATYEYEDRTDVGATVTRSGSTELALQVGGWQVKLPNEVMNKAVRLVLKDRAGDSWETNPFYPNFTSQPITRGRRGENAGRDFRTVGDFVNSAFAGVEFGREPKPVQGSYRKVQSRRDLKFNNYAKPIGDLQGRPYYRWRVFLDEDSEVLKSIREVRYLLHPTFPEPLRIRKNPGDGFALETTGWGEFWLEITVIYTDGQTSKNFYHLKLEKDWPCEGRGCE